MNLMNLLLIATLVIAFAILVSGPVRRNQNWSATMTPLASIIGSGFLVSVPLLASAIGVWAVAAVATLCILTFLIGGAIRYNIQYGEALLEKTETGHILKSVEILSHLVLTTAYFISVAYYLVLLSAFSMKFLGWNDPLLNKVIATTLVLAICGGGAIKGLSGIEKAEKITVSANLAAIAALLVALVVFGLNLPNEYSWTTAAQAKHSFDWDTLRFLMGLLIIVQGFEITPFMGQMYTAEIRIKSMRRAQIVSSLVYLVFFILMIPLFPYFTSSADIADFIDVIGRVTPYLPYVVTAGAIMSQFSASVADSIGASGLVHVTTHNRVTPKHAYILIGAVSLIVIWTTNVVSIVTLASRAFALFYALQCVVAALVAYHNKHRVRNLTYWTLSCLSFAIAILGIPAG